MWKVEFYDQIVDGVTVKFWSVTSQEFDMTFEAECETDAKWLCVTLNDLEG